MNKSNYLFLAACFALMFTQLNAQQFYFSQEKPTGCNATDGIVTLVPTRGIPPFTYLWSTGSTEVSVQNLAKGTYSVTLTDATGASIAHTNILNSQDLDLYLTDSRPAGACIGNSGALTVDPVGGSAPYLFIWSNGMTNASIQGLASGAYGVTVIDANGCSAEGVYDVKPLTSIYFPTATASILEFPDCGNQNAGVLTADLIYSNFPPYTYAWSNGATDQSIANLSEGTYSVTITDVLGCSSNASIFLDQKINMTGSVVCSGSTNGNASAQLVNGTAPVTYAWSNGAFGPNISNLTNGNYQVTATDATGCSSTGVAVVAFPQLDLHDYSQDCFSGNNGYGYCSVYYDQALTYLWDDGGTDFWNQSLSAGNHTITVTTALGCTLTGVLNIEQPLASAVTISATTSPADCSTGQGGEINLIINGGIQPYVMYAYGPDGYFSSDINSLQNLQGGSYFIYVGNTSFSCNGNTSVVIPDASGFEPTLVNNDIDCSTGYGSAAIINVTSPNVQYNWSTGNTDAALFNLTSGCYSVTVSAGSSCLEYYEFCLPFGDTIQNTSCNATATGRLFNDLGVAGCNGTLGIPFQLIRTMPSGALNFTDENGIYGISLPTGTFDLDAVQYDPGDIACPVGAKHTVNSIMGQNISNLDFHFLNANALDLRVQQTPLRTAQPGYPFSLRLEVCNDGAVPTGGTLDFEYGNILGAVTGHHFAQHPGAFALNSDNSGAPNNTADFNFPNIAAGACEFLQLDLLIATTTPGNTEFITEANVAPSVGDPTPSNNISSMHNTVMGSFDPNVVLAYPARNGNPRDGGQIYRNEDNTIVYQIFFQNTGTAPADLVIIRDSLDENLDLSTIRNITASHAMKVSTEDENKILVFKFEHINLPDSTSDYAGSIGSVQFQIDLKPGIPIGTDIKKQAAIFFDFNSPVITNQNVLTVVNSSKVAQLIDNKSIVLYPNPTDDFVGFYCDSVSKMTVFNALGDLVSTQVFETGLQQMETAAWPNGIYLLRLETNGKTRSGKLVVSH